MGTQLDRSSGVPLYLQVSDIIAQRIFEGTYRRGENLPVEKDLCEEFGVARGTIRQGLAELEQKGMVRRERGRGTFVSEVRPFTNSSGMLSGQVAFVVPYVRDSFVSTMLLGVERAAAESGISITFKHVENSLKTQNAALDDLVERGILGIVLYPVDSVHVDHIARLLRSNLPIVMVDRYLRGVPSDYVTADHFGGSLRATQHLINLGHQQIGFISWHDPAISMEHRALGYRQAMLEAGLAGGQSLVCSVDGYPRVAVEPIREFLRGNPQMTAIFAANDQIALAVYQAARQENRSIPDDLALVGFDNLDVAAHLDVPLTTVAQPVFEIGRMAIEVLLQRIRREALYPQQVILPTHLVIRQSCGFLQKSHPLS